MSIIKNFDQLATSRLREDALNILEVGYESIIIEKLINSKIIFENGSICIGDLKICLEDFERVFVVSIGKCAVNAAGALEKILGDRIFGGIVLDVKKGHFKKMISEEGTHPFPSEKNAFVTKSIIEMLEQATEKDLILTVISGGGSSLMCLPNKMNIDDFMLVTKKIMESGATISELNMVRKHLSQIKGGRFAQIAYPATVVSLILSDVPGDDLSTIASGPTVIDKTTVAEAEEILSKYKIREQLPDIKIELTETPKDKKYFEKVFNILLGSNMVALEVMKRKAEDLGYNSFIEDNKLEGEAKILGAKFAQKDYLPNSCHLWGGETTVKVKMKGKGGRNQEFALGALPFVQDDMVVVAAASDGWDNSDVAGAIVDKKMFSKVLDMRINYAEYLDENNSYPFFEEVGGHIKTGRTDTNVADFYMVLKGGDEVEEEDEVYSENEVLGDALYEVEEE